MSLLKKLAGQTAIYGVSTLLGRLLNYLLVPLYTYQFSNPKDFGIVTEFYAYISFINVLLTYGMETAFFNFSAKREDKECVYSVALFSLLASAGFFLSLMLFFAKDIAALLDHPERINDVIRVILILALDSMTAIPFAKLREQQKAKRFAALKTLNIIVNVGASLFYLYFCKNAYETDHGFLAQFYDPKIGIGYVFLANLMASAMTVVLLMPEFFQARFRFDTKLWRAMLSYALPLLIAGLAGMVNETMDRLLLKYMLPADQALHQLGVYGACYKISILMSLFIQAYRYAAEPFFFAQARQRNSIYALTMNGFIIAGSVIFLFVTLNMAWIQYFIGANYREGLDVVPILLLANLCLGIFFNLSIWYKLSEQTRFGTYLTLFGAMITLALNFYWIPSFGYRGSALATLVCYASMAMLSFMLGQKYYPQNYDLKRLLGYPSLALGIFMISTQLSEPELLTELYMKNALLLAFLALIFLIEMPKKFRAPIS